MVFQDQALFPHLSALDNVAFGPRARGVSPRARPRRPRRTWLDRLGVGDLADRRPRRALRRPGAAGGDRPRAGHRAAAAAARRAARRPRRRGRDGAAARAGPAPRGVRRHHAAGHPRRPRRAHLATRVLVIDDGPDRAGRHARGGGAAAARPTTSPGWSGSTCSGTATRFTRLQPHRRDRRRCTEPEGSARMRWRGRSSGVAPHGDAAAAARRRRGRDLIADVTPAAAAELGPGPRARGLG